MSWLLLKNSLLISAAATLLAVSSGALAAVWVASLTPRWRGRILGLSVVALALPPFLVSNCWLHFLGNAGAWRGWLPLNIFSLGGAVWVLALLLWPISLLAVTSAWRRLEPAQLEADMAVRGWSLLRGLLLPLAWPALAQAAALTFVLALNNFAVPVLLQVKVFPAEMWIRFNTEFDTLGALALSLPLAIAPLLVLIWFARRGVPWPHLEAPVPGWLFRRQIGSAWFLGCGGFTFLLLGVSAGLPLAQILSLKRTWTELPGALAAGQDAIWNSCWLPAVSATLIIALALLWARPGRRTSRLGAFLWLPFLLPGVLLGIGLIALFNHPWSALFYHTAGIVLLAYFLRYAGPGWSTVSHAVATVDPALVETARLEGASGFQVFRHACWPQIAPRVAAAWYLIFLLCLWDVESMILVFPPGGETLALRTFNLLHYGYNAQVNALCLTLLVIALAPFLAWHWFGPLLRRWSRSWRRLGPAFALAACGLLCSCGGGGSQSAGALHSQFFGAVQVIGTRGVGVGQFNKPRSVAVDRQDNLYAVDMTGRVQEFSPEGVFKLLWQMPQTDLGKPKGMGRDHFGNIIVVEPHYQRVNHFSTAGKLLAQWGHKGTNTGQLWMPRAVAVTSKGEIFLSEYGAVERVQKFVLPQVPGSAVAIEPRCVLSFGHPGNAPGEFNRPEGLAVDAQDRLYVADSCNHRIQIFSSDGKFIRCYGRAGRGKGELSYPYDICVDPEGRQYVCEFGNSRIQVFDAHDRPVEIIGGPGAEPGMFANPWSLAFDSAGDLYVADSQNHRVQKLIRKGPWPLVVSHPAPPQ